MRWGGVSILFFILISVLVVGVGTREGEGQSVGGAGGSEDGKKSVGEQGNPAQESDGSAQKNAGAQNQSNPENKKEENDPMAGMDMGHGKGDMSGHAMDAMKMQARSMIEQIEGHTGSGTDVVANSTPVEMMMTTKGAWTLMMHGTAFLVDTQESGPRAGDKLFSTNWIMPMGQRKFAGGRLTLRAMLSLEPATITDRRYPELFEEGETAYGVPIVDGQHPHNFFSELAAIYDYKLSERTLLTLYAAPVGDPALGPEAYPHRASAAEDPVAPLGHHLQDSTHIADDVVTVGLTYWKVRVEGSGFHGREPGEDRWQIDQGKMNSWATRVTVNAARDWSLQYSVGELTSAEVLFPAENLRRMTASFAYNRKMERGNWASLAVWGRNQSLLDGNVANSYLLESTLRFAEKNFVWTRIENVDRTNLLLNGENPLPVGFEEKYFARVQAYTAGYDREVARRDHVTAAVGAQVTWYGVPEVLQGTYGEHPVGVNVFLRVRGF